MKATVDSLEECLLKTLSTSTFCYLFDGEDDTFSFLGLSLSQFGALRNKISKYIFIIVPFALSIVICFYCFHDYCYYCFCFFLLLL